MREIELLSPAANKEIAKEAILHGADAVYIGATSHGARKKAGNSIDDICEVVRFAHQFRARVYVTVNTLVYDHEIQQVEKLIWDLYHIGVDAIIVQDMSLLKMNLPPIPLHASTQCDTRTVQKAIFLESVGFTQLVLARELTLSEIGDICKSVSVPVECFIHGALCVSYSGRCGASQLSLGRSANRGECAQMCRMAYTLRNGRGEILEKDKYLLSLRDFNASSQIGDLLKAGVSSFKIEGRLKDMDYVKNITAYYRRTIDKEIDANPDKYKRSSYGETVLKFEPNPYKSFNRGFTNYFLTDRRPGKMGSLQTPKSMGEKIKDIHLLHNGDGISFFNARGVYEGVNVNGIKNGRIIGNREFKIPEGAFIYRTKDILWDKQISGKSSQRYIRVSMEIDESGLSVSDERGNSVRLALDVVKEIAKKPFNPEGILGKLGDTIYVLADFNNNLNPSTFIPASHLTALRRKAVDLLDKANEATYRYTFREESGDNKGDKGIHLNYPESELDARSNVANKLAEQFYREHGVKKICSAYEVKSPSREAVVMTTRYCLLRELGACKREHRDAKTEARFKEPLTISTGPHKFRLEFDCSRCEMNVVKS